MVKREYEDEIDTGTVDPYLIQRENDEELHVFLGYRSCSGRKDKTAKLRIASTFFFFSVVARPMHHGETECLNIMVFTINKSCIQIHRD